MINRYHISAIFLFLLAAHCHSGSLDNLDTSSLSEETHSKSNTGAVNLDRQLKNPLASFYIDMVSKKIERALFSWPADEQGKQIYGNAAIAIVINQDGELKDIIVKQYDNQKLVESALKIIKLAAPFPTPPKELLGGKTSVSLTREFWFKQKQ